MIFAPPPPSSSAFRLVLSLFLLCTGINLFGVELHFRNGDRLSGVLVGRENGHILFRSAVLGEIRVDAREAVVVEKPDTPVESLAGLPPAETMAPPAPVARVFSAKASNSVKPPDSPWKGKLEFGFQQQSGRSDTTQLSIRGDAEKKAGDDTLRLEARALYSEQYEATTSDRYDALFRWRHELSPKIFGQLQSSYTKDRVKRIDHNVEQNVGVGYRVLQRERHQGSVGVGATAQYRDADGVESGMTYLGEVFQDYVYKLNGRLTFTQGGSIVYSPDERTRYAVSGSTVYPMDEGATNYRLRFNAALQGNVTEKVSLNLRFEYEFDNAILDPKAKTDQRITTSVGYGF